MHPRVRGKVDDRPTAPTVQRFCTAGIAAVDPWRAKHWRQDQKTHKMLATPHTPVQSLISVYAFVVCFCVTAVDPRRAKRQKQDQKPYTPLPKYTPFRPTKAMAFDLFPHTPHTEAVVLFERE